MSSRSFTQNLCKKYSKNGTNEICCRRKSRINKYEKLRKITNMHISSHIAQTYLINLQIILLIAGQKQSHPCGDHVQTHFNDGMAWRT